MSITYEFDPESGILHTRCEGDVTIEDTLAHFDQVAADPRLRDGCRAILEVSELGSVPDAVQIRGAAEAIPQHLNGRVTWGPWAIVADRDVVFGMARMFQVFLEEAGIHSEVFRSVREARSWLDSFAAPDG